MNRKNNKLKVYIPKLDITVPSHFTKSQRNRYILWKQNPCCCYCGSMTFFTETHRESFEEGAATIEHIWPKNDLRRLLTNYSPLAISCYKCNQKQNDTIGVSIFYASLGSLKKIDLKTLCTLIPQ